MHLLLFLFSHLLDLQHNVHLICLNVQLTKRSYFAVSDIEVTMRKDKLASLLFVYISARIFTLPLCLPLLRPKGKRILFGGK